jgi:hypothetical protein
LRVMAFSSAGTSARTVTARERLGWKRGGMGEGAREVGNGREHIAYNDTSDHPR